MERVEKREAREEGEIKGSVRNFESRSMNLQPRASAAENGRGGAARNEEEWKDVVYISHSLFEDTKK